MAEMPTTTLRIVFENRDALRQLHRAMDLLLDVAKQQPWCEEVREALDCLEKAAQGLTIQRA
jgi:hypothetical protein